MAATGIVLFREIGSRIHPSRTKLMLNYFGCCVGKLVRLARFRLRAWHR